MNAQLVEAPQQLFILIDFPKPNLTSLALASTITFSHVNKEACRKLLRKQKRKGPVVFTMR